MNKPYRISQLKAGAMLSYIAMGVQYLISIAYTPVMLRLLGQSEYGLYNLVASVVAYLGILNFGFGSAYIRYYSRYKVQDDTDRIAVLNGMFLIVFSVIGLVAVLAGTALAMTTETIFGDELTSAELTKAKTLMIILVINLAISFPNIVFSSHVTANEKFVFQKLLQMLKTVANPFVVLPLLLLGYGSVGMVVATTLLNVAIEIVNMVYCFKTLKMKFSFVNFDFKLMKEMSVFSFFIFINLVIDQVNWNVDKFILGRFHGTVSVAIYGLAAQLNMYYLSFSTAISNVFTPRVHRLVAASDNNLELTNLFTQIGRVQFTILALISSVLIFFGKPFIILWAGGNYDGSYLIALMLIVPVTLPLTQNTGIEIQRAKNMHQFRSWCYLIIVVVNIGITIPLAKAFGGFGAAIGTAVALTIGNGFIMNWYYHYKIGLNVVYFWKQILSFVPALLIPTFFGILLNYFVDLNKLVNILVFGMLYIVVYCISMWKFGMNSYEKNLISNPLKRLIKRS